MHALFSCAGVADGTPGIERINFIGHRRLINRLLDNDMLPRGSAIGMISSAAGLGWQNNLPRLHEFLDITDWDAAVEWTQANGKADYMWSKLAINLYVAREAVNFLKRGMRINAILPGPTDTPLAQANKDTWLGFATDYRAETGIEPSTSLEQAYPLVFLCSDAASYVNGVTVITDAGYTSSGITESFPPPRRYRVPQQHVLRPLPRLGVARTPANHGTVALNRVHSVFQRAGFRRAGSRR